MEPLEEIYQSSWYIYVLQGKCIIQQWIVEV